MSELNKWLRENLGPRCLAVLTSTDRRALTAAEAIVDLYSYDIYTNQDAIRAFRAVVLCMQPNARHLAYHAIAKVLDWDDRHKLWTFAGLPTVHVGRCKHERAVTGPVVNL